MMTIRCTQRLLRRVHLTDKPRPATTRLGDWYANLLFARPQQLVLCVSERTLLPVVVPASPAGELRNRLAGGLAEVLISLGIDARKVSEEVHEMSESSYSRTQNRSILGSLNDLMFHLSVYLAHDPAMPLADVSVRLAGTPMSAIGHGFPDRATQALFSGTGASA